MRFLPPLEVLEELVAQGPEILEGLEGLLGWEGPPTAPRVRRGGDNQVDDGGPAHLATARGTSKGKWTPAPCRRK